MKLFLPLTEVWANQPSFMRSIILMIASTFFAVMMHVAVRINTAELHPFEVAFFRSLFGFIIILPMIIQSRFIFLRTTKFKLHLIRGLLNTTSMLMFFTSLGLISLARVNSLSFTAPIFLAILSFIFLGERFRIYRWLAIITGFVGMLIILRPGWLEIDTGSILVIGSAFFWAGSMLFIKLLSKTENSLTIVAWMGVTTMCLSFVPALMVWQTPDPHQLMWLIVIGCLGSATQLTISQAFKEGDPTLLMPFDYVKLIWGIIFGFWLFGEIPDVFTWVGGTIIFVSGVFIAIREKRNNTQHVRNLQL